MNKIKLLYDVAVTMKKAGKIAGTLTATVRKDEVEVFNLHNEFEKTDAGKGKTTVSAKLNLDGNQVTRESTTEFDVPGCCSHGHGHGMMRRLFHGKKEREGCCGVRGFFGKLSFAFGVLNGIEAEERDNGAARLSLNLDALPAELKEGLLERLRHKAEHCCDHGFLADCHQIEGLHGQINVDLDKERRIEKITLGLDGSTRDEDGGQHEVTASGEVVLAW
jgi:hypothetical protein